MHREARRDLISIAVWVAAVITAVAIVWSIAVSWGAPLRDVDSQRIGTQPCDDDYLCAKAGWEYCASAGGTAKTPYIEEARHDEVGMTVCVIECADGTTARDYCLGEWVPADPPESEVYASGTRPRREE